MGTSASTGIPVPPHSSKAICHYNPRNEIHVIALGRKISILRRYRNLSQQAFASMVGISASYLSKIESGERLRGTSFDILYIIAHSLNQELEDLLHLSSADLLRAQEFKQCSRNRIYRSHYMSEKRRNLNQFL